MCRESKYERAWNICRVIYLLLDLRGTKIWIKWKIYVQKQPRLLEVTIMWMTTRIVVPMKSKPSSWFDKWQFKMMVEFRVKCYLIYNGTRTQIDFSSNWNFPIWILRYWMVLVFQQKLNHLKCLVYFHAFIPGTFCKNWMLILLLIRNTYRNYSALYSSIIWILLPKMKVLFECAPKCFWSKVYNNGCYR